MSLMTPEQWLVKLNFTAGDEEEIAIIKAIQRDALLHAVGIARSGWETAIAAAWAIEQEAARLTPSKGASE